MLQSMGSQRVRHDLALADNDDSVKKMLNFIHNKGSEILSYTDIICHFLKQQRSKSLIAPDLVRVWGSSYFAGRSVILVTSPWKTAW